MSFSHGRYSGLLYRALNPVFARDPLSGRGAALYGGRFNRKGREALYASLSPATALREANQVGALQPTTLVAYEADIAPVFDTRDADAMARYGIDTATLTASDWRERMLGGEPAPTQDLAERLMADGFAALLVRSFAKGAADDAFNLVLWRWQGDKRTRLVLIDDEGRLS